MPRRKWKSNITIDPKEMDVNMRNWIALTQDMDYWRALVNAALDLWVA